MQTFKKANHQTLIVRLGEPRVHTNADTLELFDIPGTSYQVVTKKDQFKAGDLAVYIQPDSVVPQTEPFKFIWGPYSFETVGNTTTVAVDSVPEAKRRITVRRFRKEWSEGLLMPVTDFLNEFRQYTQKTSGGSSMTLLEGQDVSDALGVTHWVGELDAANTGGDNERPKRRYPRSLKGWIFFLAYKLFGFRGALRGMNEEMAFDVPKFDVDNFRNYKNVLVPGEQVVITEKLHGSQGKYTYREGKMYAGSNNYWKAEKSDCVWRQALKQNPWIEEYCRANEGHVLYGEVIPTQKKYRYGCQNSVVKFRVFNIRDANNGYLPKQDVLAMTKLSTVPVLHQGPYSEALMIELANAATSTLDPTHIREGVVVTAVPDRYVRGIGRVELKYVSNTYLEQEGKRK